MTSLFDHIQEIVDKWHSIDDEIWAKIICMERNRRIAKAYARKHTININGSEEDYLDGTTLGLNSFSNPDRDSKTSYIKQHIGEGVKIKIHPSGDILVKRLSRSSVFVHQSRPDTHLRAARAAAAAAALKKSQSSSDVYALNSATEGTATEFYGIVGPARLGPKRKPAQLPLASKSAATRGKLQKDAAAQVASSSSSGVSSSRSPQYAHDKKEAATSGGGGVALQAERVVRIFSMAKFKRALEIESRRALPDRARLQSMCISVLSFVSSDEKKLNLPAWIIVINIVALDLMAGEIGLVEPYDSLGPAAPFSVSSSSANVTRGRNSRSHLELASSSSFNKSSEFDCNLSGAEDNDDDDDDVDYHQCDYDDNFHDQGDADEHAEMIEPYYKFSDSYYLNNRTNKSMQGKSAPSANNKTGARSLRSKFIVSRADHLAGNDCNQYDGQQDDNKLALDSFTQANTSNKQSKEVSSDGELQSANRKLSGSAMESADGPTNAIEQLGSSSSSGFNSHSSYALHGNSSSSPSSANSSSSNIGPREQNEDEAPQEEFKSEDGDEEKEKGKEEMRTGEQVTQQRSKFRQMLSRLERRSRQAQEQDLIVQQIVKQKKTKKVSAKEEDATASSVKAQRGRRPPKLPHGISQRAALVDDSNCEPSESFVLMSAPIPIPAPPTSAGGPSGRANLILVSPTGLSPPTSKKMGVGGVGVGAVAGADASCKAKINKLPGGIPSHAQLAPPAARKHILRYLMSATSQHQVAAQATAPKVSAPLARLNRPLPGLPKRSDESLYYSGLQARVPNHHHQAHNANAHTRKHNFTFDSQYHQQKAKLARPVPPPPQTLQAKQHNRQIPPAHITKSAINAILSDFKQSAHFKQQHLKLSNYYGSKLALAEQQQKQSQYYCPPYCATRQHEDVGNIQNQYFEERRRRQQQQQQQQQELQSSDKLGQKMRLQAQPLPAYMRSLESLNRQAGASSSGNQKSLSSLFNHVGGFLKRSSKCS